MALSRIARNVVAFAAFSLAACKKSPASVQDAPPLATSSASSTEHDHKHELNLPPVGRAVKVNFDGKSADVVLSSVAGTPFGVPVTTVWSSAFGPVDPAALHFDFVGSDGFRASAREKCKSLLTGRDLATASIDVTTHNLAFEEGSKLPGCYRVKAIVSVDVTR